VEEANKFMGTVEIEGVDVMGKGHSPKCILRPGAQDTCLDNVSLESIQGAGHNCAIDGFRLSKENEPGVSVGLEQTFNFLEFNPIVSEKQLAKAAPVDLCAKSTILLQRLGFAT